MNRFLVFLIFASSPSLYADISTKKLNNNNIRIERQAINTNGFYYGLKSKKSLKKFKVNDCHFSYEKGIKEDDTQKRKLKYERFIVNFSGIDKNGESSFDSVSYGHSNYYLKFKPLDFTQSFDYKVVPSSVNNENKVSTKVKATRFNHKKLKVEFKHKEQYSTANSSFFIRNEVRTYHVVVNYSQFDDKKIALENIQITAWRRIHGATRKREKIINVECSQFDKMSSTSFESDFIDKGFMRIFAAPASFKS